MRILSKLLSVGPGGWRDLWNAQCAVVRWTVAKRLRRRGRLVQRSDSGQQPRESDGAARASPLPPRALELATAVDRVARFGPLRPQCLVRSLALHQLVRDAGFDGCEVKFGIRRASDALEGHVWVELHGEVLGDEPRHVGRYTPVPELQYLGE